VTFEYAVIGLLAAVPIAVLLIVLALRGYDVTLLLRRRRDKDDT
jgi:hypothetical protein